MLFMEEKEIFIFRNVKVQEKYSIQCGKKHRYESLCQKR